MRLPFKEKAPQVTVCVLWALAGFFVLFSGWVDAEPGWRDIMDQSGKLDGYTYQTSYAYSDSHYGTMKVWVQGAARRVEMYNQSTGERMILLTRPQDSAFYQIDPQRKEAIAFEYGDTTAPQEDLDDTLYAVAANRYDPDFLDRVQQVTFEMQRGKERLVLTFRSPHRGSEEIYRLWICPQYGLPVREEMVMADGRKLQRFYTDLQEGPFPGSLFEVPDEVEIIKRTRFH